MQLFNKFEKRALSGSMNDIQIYLEFLQYNYFPTIAKISKDKNINYQEYWNKVFMKDGVLSKIELKLESDKEKEILKDFRHTMQFTEYVPAQSYEQYQIMCNRLEEKAKKGRRVDVETFTLYLEEKYFPFMKTYFGPDIKRYNELWNNVFGDKGVLAKLKEML